MQPKIFKPLILIALLGICISMLSSCKTGKRRGCGCGADLNRIYKPSKHRH